MKKIKAITWGIIAITFIISISSIIFLPDEIAVQWNEQGVSNVGSKYTVMYLPILSFVICIAYMKMAKTLQHIVPLVTAALILIAEGVILVNAFGAVNITHIGTEESNLWIGRIISIIVGIAIMIIGNRLPKTIMNYYIGVRTPWAMDNQDLWTKTQRLAGKVWFIAGIILILLAFAPTSIGHIGKILTLIGMVLIPRAYSMKLYERTKK